jgi:hypothetical protein
VATTDIAIVTVTWARDPAEAALIAGALELLAGAGAPVIVADRTGSPAFTARLARVGVRLVTPAGPGLVAQVQAAAAAAASLGTRFLLYTEPDKQAFFRDSLPGFLARAPRGDDVGVVLAARTDESFATFPPMQRYVETVVNTLCGQLTGVSADYSFGPFLLHRNLLPHIARMPAEVGWGWRPSTFLAAHRQGLRIVPIADELPCPLDQRREDDADRSHRLRQLSQNVRGLVD